MKENLDSLKTEIQDYLDHNGFTTFFGLSRAYEDSNVVWWDVEKHPDYSTFLKTAEATGIRLIVLHTREMTEEAIDQAFDELESAALDRDQHRTYEKRLEGIRHYDGFTCVVELSYTHEGQVYIFELKTEWFNEFTELVDDLMASVDPFASGDDGGDDGSLGGYFSQN